LDFFVTRGKFDLYMDEKFGITKNPTLMQVLRYEFLLPRYLHNNI